ncbi:hypothetical protein DRJ22_05955 [Candidatus Woesearchaeota archaeon]|nr:MAG: hypothetical protein DRJ22_05955 [Candidatus Woesearchaeota archaeon]
MAFFSSFFDNISDLHFYFDNSVVSALKPHILQLPDIFFHRLFNLLSKDYVVGVVNPKTILKAVLPALKKSCPAKFVVVNGFISGFELVSSLSDVDVVLCEPVSFSEAGFCFPPSDLKFLKNKPFFACASLIQYSVVVPDSCDVLDKGRLVCESGVLNLENAVLEVRSFFPFFTDF